MKRILLWTVVAGLTLAAVDVNAVNRIRRFSASLEPRNEVPAVSSPARGEFQAVIDDASESVEYTLTYDNLQANITQAHIHFAQPNVNGGIMVWLCGTSDGTPPTPGPMGTQVCPQSGMISGVITAANVVAINAQGIAPGEFDEFASAVRSGFAYANVHTAQSPGGEIRGQVKPGRR
jgi:hypothetical protein